MPNTKVRILVVEDDPGIQELVQEILSEKGWSLSGALTGSQALDLVLKEPWDLVLLDYSLPDINALELVSKAEEKGTLPPFVMTTGAGDERVAVETMRRGARDYLVKDSHYLDRLPLVVERVLQELSVEKRLEQSEAALKKSEARSRMITESVDDVIWLLDLQSQRFTYVSPSVYRLRGYTPEEVLEQTFQESLTPESCQRILTLLPLRLEEYYRSDRSQKVHTDRVDQPHKNGKIISTEVVTTVIEDDQGNVVEILGVTRDISVRLEMERRLLQSQKLESLGLLAGGVAHDFNNLLAAMMGNLELALLKLSPGHEVASHLQLANQSALRAAELIRKLLVYSGQGTVVMQGFNLSHFVRENLELLKVILARSVQLDVSLDSHQTMIRGDQGQIQQLLMNLITNASEAIGSSPGHIGVSSGVTFLSSKEISNLRTGQDLLEGSYVFLEITDTGCGMSDDTKLRIFDPFFTTKVTGRGLGMAAILGIVRGHSGGLSLVSEPNKGTQFRIYFPLSHEDAGSEVHEVNHHEDPSRGVCEENNGKTVLVVDDEEAVRTMTASILTELGYTVVSASGGKEAIKLLGEDPEKFRCILLDLTMPEMDGTEVLDVLKQSPCSASVILTSGYSLQMAQKKVPREQYDGFLQKPFHFSELKGLLDTLL